MKTSRGTAYAHLRGLLGVEAGEGRAVGLMVALYFLLAAAFVFVQTSAYGLYIQEFGAENLPFAYLSIAAFASLLAFFYLKLSERLAFRALAFIDLGFLAAACVLFWAGLQAGLKHWFIFLLPFWFQTIINLANLVVWPLAGRIFNVRQAKRVFGLVGSGNWLANILIGGFAVAPLLAFAGVADLYLFAAIAVVAAGLVLWAIFGGKLVPPIAVQPSVAPRRAGRAQKPAASPFRNPYNRFIFAYVLLWWVSFYFIDNIFYDLAGAMYPDGAQLAVFIGRQLSVIGIIALVTGLLLTGRIVRRYGLRTALLVMPVVVIFCTLVLALGGLLKAPSGILFWAAAVGKTLNVAVGFSLSFAAGTLLYQPIIGSERNRTQTTAEGIVQPLAIGLAGALLLLFHTALHFSATGLSFVFLIIGALWLWVIARLSKEYPRVLSDALVKRSLGDSTTLLFDPAGIAQLHAGLKSRNAGTVLYALNQLEQVEADAWAGTLRAALPDLLGHPAPEVRAFALERIHAGGFADVAPLVRNCLSSEPVPQVHGAAVRFLAAFDGVSDQQVDAAVQSPERAIRGGALAGLLSSGMPAKVERATTLLDQIAASTDPEERLLAASVLEETAYPNARTYISRLLQDERLEVRQAAVRAAGQREDAGLLRDVVAASHFPETARVAEQVLMARGAAALPAILDALKASDAASPSAGTASLLRVLGGIGGEQAVRALEPWMNCPDPGVRLQALQSLSAAGYHAASRSKLLELIKREIGEAAWLTAAMQLLAGMGTSGDVAVLMDALRSALQDCRRGVLLLLSFGMEARSIMRASKALDEAGSSASAFALEAVDASLPAAWKSLILPLLEDRAPAERLALWRSAGVRAAVPSLDALIEALAGTQGGNRGSRWARLCAIHLAGMRKVVACRSSLEALKSDLDASIAGLSRWSLAQMGMDIPMQGEVAMLSLVEKVLALKAASLFRQTPDAVLADVAERVDEVSFGAGETVFEKGDRGDSLYIIVSGRVQVTDGGRLLNELGEGAIFGELALLEPAPRSATVRAAESAHLLQLDEAHFRLVLAERPEVAAAIIPVLTGYIRSLLASSSNAASATLPKMLEA